MKLLLGLLVTMLISFHAYGKVIESSDICILEFKSQEPLPSKISTICVKGYLYSDTAGFHGRTPGLPLGFGCDCKTGKIYDVDGEDVN